MVPCPGMMAWRRQRVKTAPDRGGDEEVSDSWKVEALFLPRKHMNLVGLGGQSPKMTLWILDVQWLCGFHSPLQGFVARAGHSGVLGPASPGAWCLCRTGCLCQTRRLWEPCILLPSQAFIGVQGSCGEDAGAAGEKVLSLSASSAAAKYEDTLAFSVVFSAMLIKQTSTMGNTKITPHLLCRIM